MIYTPEEVAARWKISPDTIYRMLASGKLRGFKTGRVWRITEAAMLEVEGSTGTADKYVKEEENANRTETPPLMGETGRGVRKVYR